MKALRFVLAAPLQKPQLFQKIETAVELDQVCAGGPRLWTNDGVPIMDLGDAGHIVGLVFSKTSATPLLCLPPDAPLKGGPAALAAWLMRACWGGYVALLSDRATGRIAAIVDPSGLCPVYRSKTLTHIILASHPGLVRTVTSAPLVVSWQGLRSYLLRPELRQISTCLVGITELPPGELVRIDERSLGGERIWRPDDFMPGRITMSFDEAAEELRNIAIPVIGAWAKMLGPVAVAASGGVDSSFICAALKAGDESFTCATVSTDDASGDERAFVNMLGKHLGVQTKSAIYDPATVDPQRGVSAGLARPTRKAFMAALDTALFEAGRSVGASVIFDGNGGDNLFCFLHSSAPVVDRLRCEGLGRGSFSTFFDMCRVTGCDMPTMARAMMRRLSRREFPKWPADISLLAGVPEVHEEIEPLTPWFQTDVGRHGGKRDHLALIMRAQHHVHGLTTCGLPRFSPLMSQPLIEFCLGIPTWIWPEGGINRALARSAFAAELPREILTRTSKSGPDSFIRRSFDQHRLTIRNFLMDGLLAQHEVIDRSAVHDALNSDVISGGDIVYRLLDLAEAESWARSWQN
tara:strand:+ start:551 stop:2284 length:1734 start_codon:yes stop_codon:yes gene_type:complete